MTKENYTHIQLLLDRSGSMMAIKDDAEGGVNAFIADQKNVPGEATVGLAQFDTQYDVVWAPQPIVNISNYVLNPRGGTALLDGIGRCVTETGEWLASLAEEDRPSQVIFVIVTDGYENSSHEWTNDQIKELVTKQTDEFGWSFVYLAAGQDAIKVGATMGMTANSSMSYNAAKTGETYGTLSSSTTIARGKGGPVIFNDEDRDTVK